MDKKNQSVDIKIENLSVAFGNTKVLKDINLKIKAGEFFAFLGPSGSGKSTLLRSIAGFGPKPKGKIFIDKQNITNIPPWKRNVGMVFQNYALWPHMSVRRNVAFGLEERKVSKEEINKRVDKALRLVELQDFAKQRPNELSGGQQQRVALARTIVIEPRVLLLDEPLSNLDANLRIQMRTDILTLQRKLGLTTIFVTHDQEEANSISDRMAVLDNGCINQVGKPIELYDTPKNLFVAKFLGSANIITGEIKSDSNHKQNVFISTNGLRINIDEAVKDNASLVFRPQNVSITKTKPRQKDGIIISGRIIHREFLGSAFRYSIDVNGHFLFVDSVHSLGSTYLEENTNVFICINKGQYNII